MGNYDSLRKLRLFITLSFSLTHSMLTLLICACLVILGAALENTSHPRVLRRLLDANGLITTSDPLSASFGTPVLDTTNIPHDGIYRDGSDLGPGDSIYELVDFALGVLGLAGD